MSLKFHSDFCKQSSSQLTVMTGVYLPLPIVHNKLYSFYRSKANTSFIQCSSKGFHHLLVILWFDVTRWHHYQGECAEFPSTFFLLRVVYYNYYFVTLLQTSGNSYDLMISSQHVPSQNSFMALFIKLQQFLIWRTQVTCRAKIEHTWFWLEAPALNTNLELWPIAC